MLATFAACNQVSNASHPLESPATPPATPTSPYNPPSRHLLMHKDMATPLSRLEKNVVLLTLTKIYVVYSRMNGHEGGDIRVCGGMGCVRGRGLVPCASGGVSYVCVLVCEERCRQWHSRQNATKTNTHARSHSQAPKAIETKLKLKK